MESMFFDTSAFNQPLSFDTSKVTTMESMFGAASAFNQPLSFDTSKVTDMRYMFEGANSLSDANKRLIRCAWENIGSSVARATLKTTTTGRPQNVRCAYSARRERASLLPCTNEFDRG